MTLARRTAPRRKTEPTIALINVVFLMLIFFLVAGTVAVPLDADLTLVRTDALEGRAPPDALILLSDGRLMFRGVETDVATYVAASKDSTLRIVPDRAVPAARLIEVTLALRAEGAERVMIVTERGLK